MKPVKISILILVILTISVYANSIYIGHTTKTIAEKVDKIDTENTENAAESFDELFDEFKKAERYISITVSHDDLTNIEENFSEIIGAANAGNNIGVTTAKSRLKDALIHLGRLSGINIDSIL